MPPSAPRSWKETRLWWASKNASAPPAPLGAILGWAQRLQLQRIEREQELQAFAVIERNAKAQAKLIDDLLDMSRILSGKLRIDLSPIDLVSAVRAATDAIQPLANKKSITLSARFDHLPPPVRGDVSHNQQNNTNLLDNAVKFTPC